MLNSSSDDDSKGSQWQPHDLARSQLPTIKKEEDRDFKESLDCSLNSDSQMNSWTYCHPEDWGKEQILDWIYTVADGVQSLLEQEVGEAPEIVGERFQDLRGRDLIKMSREHLTDLEPNYGEHIYKLLQELLKKTRKLQMNRSN